MLGNLGSKPSMVGFTPRNDNKIFFPFDGLPVAGWIACELCCGISSLGFHVQINMGHEHSLIVSGFDEAFVVLGIPF